MSVYLMQALQNLEPTMATAVRTAFDANDPALLPAYLGPIAEKDFSFCFDRVRRKIMYNLHLFNWRVDTSTFDPGATPNDTGLALWDGAVVIGAASDYNSFNSKNYTTAEYDLDTGVVTYFPAFNTTYLTPSGLFPIPVGAARYVDALANYWSSPRLIDPRTGNVFSHINGSNVGCQVYFFERAKSFQQAISPWAKLSGLGTDGHMALFGMSSNYTYAINSPKIQMTPRTQLAAETAVDYKSTYAYFDFPFPANTSWNRVCFDFTDHHYVAGFTFSGTRNVKLYKFTEPSATVIGGGGTVGGGYTEITPWTSTTGPNSNIAGYTLDSTDPNSAQGWNKIIMMYLAETANIAMITKLLPGDKINLSTDPALLRFDCTYVPVGGGSYDYHEGFIQGFMKADWTAGTNAADSKWVVRDLIEIDSDLNAHSFDFRPYGATYQRRQFFCIVQEIVGGVYVNPWVNGSATDTGNEFNHILILTYDFIPGAAPALVSQMDEALWYSRYAYMGVPSPMGDVLDNWHDNRGDRPWLASGFWDATTQAWYFWGGDDMPLLDPAYQDRTFLEISTGDITGTAPFLKISVSAGVRRTSSSAWAIRRGAALGG